MRTLSYQYVTDIAGQKNAVLINYADWESIVKDLNELDKLRNKQLFLHDLKTAVDDVNLHLRGEKKLKTLDELIDEL